MTETDYHHYCFLLAHTFCRSLAPEIAHTGIWMCQPRPHWQLCLISRMPPPYLLCMKNTSAAVCNIGVTTCVVK